MSTTYTGTPSLTNTIQIPQDLDNADAASVNVSAKAEIDNQVSLFQLYGQLMSSTSPIKIQCTDGVTIKVSPLSSVLLNVAGTWNTLLTTTESNVTAANVEMAGVFVANTWYYLYVYSLAGVAAFQLTTTVPDGYRLYKNGSFGFKYLCAVRTDGSANVIPFTKYNGMTIYSGLENIGTGPPPPPNTNNITALASSNRIPITATIGKFGVLINTTPGGLSGEIRFYSSALVVTDPYISVTYPGNGYQSLYFDSPVDISQQLWCKVQPFTGVTPGISYYCIGYYE